MGAEAELGGLEGVGLRHCGLGAVEAVEDELAEEAEADLAGDVEVSLAGVVLMVMGFMGARAEPEDRPARGLWGRLARTTGTQGEDGA